MAAGGRTEPLANPTRRASEVPAMQRLTLPVAAAALLLAATASVAIGAKPSNGCPPETSGYFLVDRDRWWDETVAGFEAEGIPVYEADGTTFTAEFNAFAADFGLVDGAGLEAFVRGAQWDAFDHNQNGLTCMKPRHSSPGVGNPAYFFNGVDDQSASHGD
jgi:hypothetical protein